MTRNDVLIVGAGPTGLVLALWLTKLGVGVRIIDRTAEPGTTSRALAVAAHTLELYRQLDLADAVIARGHKVRAANLWVRGEAEARVPFAAIGEDLSPYSFLQIFPQDEHERLLVERLGQLGVTVERRTELLDFTDHGDRIVARLRGEHGEETAEFSYLAGCDGAHSLVRETISAGFSGGTYRELFYVADVEASGASINGELHVDLDEADFLAIFPLADTRRARLIGTVRDERADHADTLTFDDVSRQAIENLKIKIEKVNWFSTYHVHHRVAGQFRKGRTFLLGDAAHIHSPVGGQGMNTGIGDAINLAWKLSSVLAAQAPDALLDSYEIERIAFAKRLVATTDRIFTFVTADGRIADLVRTRIAPIVVPRILSIDRVREFIFRTVSQITLNYRQSPLSEGSAGEVRGGERLPWAPVDGLDNFTSLAATQWQIHIYGVASEDVRSWCERHRAPLSVFDWRPAYEEAGLARDALYLLRPDTYVALADPKASVDTLERYCSGRGLSVGSAR
ncbi:FAD-dependent monooxygenase [Mesorhizobium sp. ESP7-2]|uniref:FAD-dependent monooxygenase n=1 Tax=Mesorhizobium sp. ESP7-2 TaxID=2876622 RepID=UPI001CCCBCB1|nr:FAD-dependent monooxygenase [Mesorhizobium sp. ESP7-2]MBZ9711249.1 FAD-dependent monooxygenase [Mesorhizobium sp. ESP7-2]